MERFAAAAGIKFVHVPYPGLAPAMRDLLAGHIEAIFDTPGNALPHVASGGVKVLAVTGEADPRTAERAGDRRNPARHRPHRLVRGGRAAEDAGGNRHAAVTGDRRMMKQPDVAKRIAEFTVTAVGGSPAETAALIKRESELTAP